MERRALTGPGAAVWYLVRLGLMTGRRFEAALATHGLTPPEAMMLRRVAHSADPTVLALAGECGLTASTAVGVLDRLEKGEFIRRERDVADRRVVRVSVTPRGRAIAAAVPDLAAGLEAELLAGLTAAERKTLRELLERTYAGLVAASPELEQRVRAEAIARWAPPAGRARAVDTARRGAKRAGAKGKGRDG